MLFAQVGGVLFSAAAVPDTAYVGQQVSYDGILQIDASVRFLESPRFTPPTIAGVMTYVFPLDTMTRRSSPIQAASATQYIYHRVLFPMVEGIDTILPSQLTYTLVNDADPYASRSITQRSVPQRLVVLPLPGAGRPSDFSGAVGQFTLAAVIADTQLRVGNSSIVRVTITGTGNIKLLRGPQLVISWATIATMPDSAAWTFAGTMMRGFKEFRWRITPRSSGPHTIPSLTFSYFDPAVKKYRTIATAAIPLVVAEQSRKQNDDAALAVAQSPSIMHVTGFVVTCATLLIVLVLIVLIVGVRRRAHRPSTDTELPNTQRPSNT